MDGNQTLNLQQPLRECLRTANYLGKDVIYNICTNTEKTIPWGGADWTLYLLLTLAGIGLVTVIFCFAFYVIFGD